MAWPTHIVAAGGYVFDKSGNILIVKTNHRGWDCTRGQIEVGENIEEGVGITPVPTKVMFDFICDYIDGELTTSDETSESIWVPKNKVLEYVTAPACLFRFKNVIEFDGHIHYCSYVTKPEFKVLSSRFV